MKMIKIGYKVLIKAINKSLFFIALLHIYAIMYLCIYGKNYF